MSLDRILPGQPGPTRKDTNDGSWVVPMSVGSAVINDPNVRTYGKKIKGFAEYQLQRSPDFVVGQWESVKGLSQKLTEKSQTLMPGMVKLGQAPSLSQLSGIGQHMVDWEDIKQGGKGVYLQQVKDNLKGAFRANVHTDGLSLIDILKNPKQHWHSGLKTGGKTLNAIFTRPVAEVAAGSTNLFNAALSGLALGTMAYDIGSKTLKANTEARRHEDGTWGGRLRTFQETAGTLLHKTTKHALTWSAGSLGVLLGKAFGITLKQKFGPVADIPGIAVGVVGGALAAGTTQAVLNKLSPDKY